MSTAHKRVCCVLYRSLLSASKRYEALQKVPNRYQTHLRDDLQAFAEARLLSEQSLKNLKQMNDSSNETFSFQRARDLIRAEFKSVNNSVESSEPIERGFAALRHFVKRILQFESSSDCTTNDVRVQVWSRPLQQKPDPLNQFWFAYTVRLTNMSSTRTVQLLSRRWMITAADGQSETVEGPGVVGFTPLLTPGEVFQYESGTRLDTPSGSMEGSYRMRVVEVGAPSSGNPAQIDLPQSELDIRISPFKLQPLLPGA
eukprot:GILK01013856.1.p1 GENE.GILK01013856.1~~GILK01013856.1.p1  ORF type:complete len:270 (+),score=16.90 GILK01013856.1:40-810(+)